MLSKLPPSITSIFSGSQTYCRAVYFPWLLELRSSPTFVTLVCSVAIFTDGFIYGVVVPVLPFSLADRVGMPQDHVQKWTSVLLATYAGGFLVACPAVGWITDHCPSRRTVYLFAIFLLMVSTVLFCLGSSVAIFVIARVLQGGSSAVTWTAGLALLSDTMDQSKIGKAMGFCSLSLNGALFLAPLVGGLVLEKCGFINVFVISFVFIFVDLVLRLLVVEQKSAQRHTRRRPSLYWIITYGLQGTPSISASPSSGVEDIEPLVLNWDNDPDPPAYSGLQSDDLKVSRFSRLPPLLSLLRSQRLRVILLANFVQVTTITALDPVLPLYTHDTFGWGPLGAGLIFMPVVLPAMVAPWIGELADKYGSRLFIFGGFVLATPFLIFLRFVKDDSAGHVALLCFLLSFLGLATALISAPVMAEVTYMVEAEERREPGVFGSKGAYAQAFALYSFTTAAGLLAGPCWGGFISDAAGWDTMTLTLSALNTVTAITLFLWLR